MKKIGLMFDILFQCLIETKEGKKILLLFSKWSSFFSNIV